MKAWQFRNTLNRNRRVDEPTGTPDHTSERSHGEIGATEIGGYLLAAFACLSAMLWIANGIVRLVFPPGSLLGDVMVIVFGIVGVAISFLIPKPRWWGYVAFAFIGAFHALLLSGMLALPVLWASHQAGYPLTETPPLDEPILAAWFFLMFASTAVLCVRLRSVLRENSNNPLWVRFVLLVTRSVFIGHMIGTGILCSLGIIGGFSYLAWDLYRNW